MEHDMQDKINYAVKKWELEHLEVIYEHLTKGVFTAGSTYLNWLEQICEYCVRHQVVEDMASRAHLFCEEMFEKYPDRVLLHGDLHHDNLLLKADGSYAMVDPKGIVGPAIMDLPRFILNEPDTDYACPDRRHIEEVIRLLGEQSGYPAADIVKLFYMETVLGNVWCAEDGEEMNREEMELAELLLSVAP